jgi:hypothetical protein
MRQFQAGLNKFNKHRQEETVPPPVVLPFDYYGRYGETQPDFLRVWIEWNFPAPDYTLIEGSIDGGVTWNTAVISDPSLGWGACRWECVPVGWDPANTSLEINFLIRATDGTNNYAGSGLFYTEIV